MAPVRSMTLSVTPVGVSNVQVILPMRRGGQIIPFDIDGEGTCAGMAITSGVGFGRYITTPGIQAEARVHLASGAAGWTFGFIQFMRFQVLDVVYRGDTPEEGSIFAQFHPLSEQSRLSIDQAPGADATLPWYHPRSVAAASTAVGAMLAIPFNDTPSDFIVCRRMNRYHRLRPANWLHHLWSRFQFTTVVAARSPAGRVEPLRTFDWAVEWNLNFNRGHGADPNEN